MEPQSLVRVYNEAMGVKGAKGKLQKIDPSGYYEISLEIKDHFYQALLPIQGTVLLAATPIPASEETIEYERY